MIFEFPYNFWIGTAENYKEIFSKRYAYGDTNPFDQNSQQIWYKKGDLLPDEPNITQQNQSGREIFYVIIFYLNNLRVINKKVFHLRLIFKKVIYFFYQLLE